MAEVHALPINERKYPPNDAIIQVAREILRDAKSGRIQALAAAMATNDRMTETTTVYTHLFEHTLFTAVGSMTFRMYSHRSADGLDVTSEPLTENDE